MFEEISVPFVIVITFLNCSWYTLVMSNVVDSYHCLIYFFILHNKNELNNNMLNEGEYIIV